MSNVYYHPEKWGLSKIGEIAEPLGGYEFHIVCVWEDAFGKLYWAASSGCSCPTPFDEYRSITMLNVADSRTYPDLESYLNSTQELDAIEKRALLDQVLVKLHPVTEGQVANAVNRLTKLIESLRP